MKRIAAIVAGLLALAVGIASGQTTPQVQTTYNAWNLTLARPTSGPSIPVTPGATLCGIYLYHPSINTTITPQGSNDGVTWAPVTTINRGSITASGLFVGSTPYKFFRPYFNSYSGTINGYEACADNTTSLVAPLLSGQAAVLQSLNLLGLVGHDGCLQSTSGAVSSSGVACGTGTGAATTILPGVCTSPSPAPSPSGAVSVNYTCATPGPQATPSPTATTCVAITSTWPYTIGYSCATPGPQATPSPTATAVATAGAPSLVYSSTWPYTETMAWLQPRVDFQNGGGNNSAATGTTANTYQVITAEGGTTGISQGTNGNWLLTVTATVNIAAGSVNTNGVYGCIVAAAVTGITKQDSTRGNGASDCVTTATNSEGGISTFGQNVATNGAASLGGTYVGHFIVANSTAYNFSLEVASAGTVSVTVLGAISSTAEAR